MQAVSPECSKISQVKVNAAGSSPVRDFYYLCSRENGSDGSLPFCMKFEADFLVLT